MTPAVLLNTLIARGVCLIPDGDALIVQPASKLTDAERQAIRRHKAELLRLLTAKNAPATPRPAPYGDAARNQPTIADRVAAAWKPDKWIAYREGNQLLTAKYAGVSVGRVNLWLADGAMRVVSADSIALDWCPEAAEIFEKRLCLMLEAGIREDVARQRAEECTRECSRCIDAAGGWDRTR